MYHVSCILHPSDPHTEARIAVFTEVFRDVLEVSEGLQVHIRSRGNQEFPRGAVLYTCGGQF